MNNKLFDDFSLWLDKILCNIDDIPIAWCFNLYKPISVELVGTKSYDRKDEDWACDEIYASSDSYSNFEINSENWETALRETVKLVENYLKFGENKVKLLESYAVGCGFVDGDLKILYENSNKKFRPKKSKVTIEMINELPIFKLCAWLVVYAGYEEINRTTFATNFLDFQAGDKQPTELDLEDMRRLLFESMDKQKIKL